MSVATTAPDFARAPMIHWETIATSMDHRDRMEMVKHLQEIGERALRLAAYIQTRDNSTHANAVKAQNRDGRTIRKMLGFTYPEQADVNF